MARRVRSNGAAYRRRRAADTARWRSRRRRCVELYAIEVGTHEIDLAIMHGGLRENRLHDKLAISVALGRLLRRALVALVLHEEQQRR
jgi:hypothetical protein